MKALVLMITLAVSTTCFGFSITMNIARVNQGFSTACDSAVENCLHLFAIDASGATANSVLAANGSALNIVAIHLYSGPMSGDDLNLKVVAELKKIGANAKVMAYAETNGGDGMRAAYVSQDIFADGGTVNLNAESTTRVAEAFSAYTTAVQSTKNDMSYADFLAAYDNAANDQETLLATINGTAGCAGGHATLTAALDSCGDLYARGGFAFKSWIKLLLQ